MIMLLIMHMMPDSSCRPSKSDQKIRITSTSRYIHGYIIDLFFLCVIYLNFTINSIISRVQHLRFPYFGETDDPNRPSLHLL
jgi:hypothetical protein